MFYTVFSTNVSPYMQWQSDLLEYSWNSVGQEGVLVRLVATTDPANLPKQRFAHCVATTLWDVNPHSDDAYPVYNKPASLLEWLWRDRPEGNVLLLDPDCVFRAPVTRRVTQGAPVSQSWVNLSLAKPSSQHPFGLGKAFGFFNDYCVKTDVGIAPVMIPTLIHTTDLRRICARWLELCGVVRKHYRNAQGLPIWEADMYAYLAACAEYGLEHEPVSLGICTNWSPDQAPAAPIIHYCQNIVGVDGQTIVGKGSYRPWARVPVDVEPACDYGRDFVAILNGYVDAVAPSNRHAAAVTPIADDKSSAALPNDDTMQQAWARRAPIVERLFTELSGAVSDGIFAGLRLSREVFWGDGDLAAKLLGCFEQELQPALSRAVRRLPDRVVNVGCAEGYYGVGLACLLPATPVTCFEEVEAGRRITGTMARANGVDDRLTILGRCEPSALGQVIGGGTALVVMDCEGAEVALLDLGAVPELARCDIIVECHDFAVAGATDILRRRLETTHIIEVIDESSRNPNLFPHLKGLSSFDRWNAIQEGRPRTMTWLACWPRSRGAGPRARMMVDFGGGYRRTMHYRPGSTDEDVIRAIEGHQYDFNRLGRHRELMAHAERRSIAGGRPLVVDAGGNIGTSAVWFTFHVPDCKVLSLEPDAGNFALLEQNVSGLAVSAQQVAVAARFGRVVLSDPGLGHCGLRTVAASESAAAAVPCMTINEIYSDLKPEVFPFIVKVDIEGAEADLFSCNTEWVRKTPLIILELHDWLLQRSASSRSFLRCMGQHDRDFVYFGEHIYSIANDLG